MSRTILYLVPESGEIQSYAEYRNSHGSGSYIFTALCDRYLDGMQWICSGDNINRLWGLAKDDRLPKHHKIALMTTFDRVMVRRENLGRTADAFELFVEDFPPGRRVCSLLKQAGDLRLISHEPVCFAACWQQTSVSMYVWMVRGQETEPGGYDYRPWDVSRDEGHWFLFDDLGADPDYQATIRDHWSKAKDGQKNAHGRDHTYWMGYRDAVHGISDQCGFDPEAP